MPAPTPSASAAPLPTVASFEGYSREAIDFLAELAANNERAWFQPRKPDYERLLKRPTEALCVALAERFAARGLPLLADPVRSPFRIYRDTRFSKDKSPYKTHVGVSFPWTAGPTGHSAGGYFHLQPGEVFIGGGMWHPEPARLAAWRALVVAEPRRVHAAIDDPAFVAAFGDVHGDALARVPTGFPKDHPDAALLKLKDVTFGRRLSDADVLSPSLPDILADAFAAARPVFALFAGLPA